jgi:hypothetical protein
MRRAAVGALSLLAGCAGWSYLELPADTVLAPRQQVQIWSGSTAQVFHAVRVTEDSLFGVPFQKPPACDSCRVALPRAAVDSVRTGNLEGPGIVFATLPFVVLIYLMITLRDLGD